MKGFTPVRTARVIASCIALLGMFCLLIERILVTVLQVAGEGVKMGIARYSNFTGRMALQNFPEDKKLYGLLKEVENILPTADTALIVLMVLAVVLLVVAVVGLALPRQFGHVLVALKLLRWTDCGCAEGESVSETGESLKALKNVKCHGPSAKVVAVVAVIIIAILVVSLCVRACSNAAEASNVEAAVQELDQQALVYINAQKDYFAKKKVVGGPKALQLPDSVSTEYFTYKVTGSRFTAISNVPLNSCPAGTKWTVSSSSKGFFTQELVLYRNAPKDTNCVKLLPDFKNLGRNKP
ncbi:MAG: hypothetical protein MJY99_07385 [Fibrobacter sp.]|nr:hypothetical protein [Fibrobacter sp.]